MYEILDHTADVKIKITSNNIFDFFKNLIDSLNTIINFSENEVSYILNKKKYKNTKIVLQDFDDYQKVFNFISKYIYYLDAKAMLIIDINYITVKKEIWEIGVKLIKVDKKKFKGYLKAPTYCDFNFKSEYYLEVIIDV